jgi:hypothetical protein
MEICGAKESRNKILVVGDEFVDKLSLIDGLFSFKGTLKLIIEC